MCLRSNALNREVHTQIRKCRATIESSSVSKRKLERLHTVLLGIAEGIISIDGEVSFVTNRGQRSVKTPIIRLHNALES